MSPQRVLLTAAPPTVEGDWRVVVDWLQAAAAYDHPLEIAACGAALRWLSGCDADSAAARAAFSSLALLDVQRIQVPAGSQLDGPPAAFALVPLAPAEWQTWLRDGTLQVLT